MPSKSAEAAAALPSIGRDRIAGFRAAIAAARAEGTKPERMILNLTGADEALLKRDPSVAVQEISFANGEMRFLGVKVVAGAVTTSALATA